MYNYIKIKLFIRIFDNGIENTNFNII